MTADVLVVDNYDSFTWNLVQALGALGADVRVLRNDAVDPETLARRPPGRIVLSPGPKSPAEAGLCNDLIRRFGPDIPILGVCLGHQCIAHALGGSVVRALRPVHGKTSAVRHDGRGVFAGLPNPFSAMRYNSLVVEESTLPAGLAVSARSEDGEIMGLRHDAWPLEGVQFHPESYRTEAGERLLRNFLQGPRPGSDVPPPGGTS
ncbi:MAG TPA: aminodeoxychorismate/anthranilate synthase component II [Planctomycetota bacterium]|nr:aminodeoxychorismate/anthranilate synthase component II [Planctomycetota bacterium]